jgi:RNA polymerase sigma-70 factor, ECF subfamily
MSILSDASNSSGGRETAACSPNPMRLLEAGFEPLYAAVYRYLVHRVFDRERAEEMTAETFYRAAAALLNLYSGREAGGLISDARQMEMWLLRIATNVANTEHRRARWRRLVFERLLRIRPASSPPPDDDSEDPQAAKVRDVLRRLPPRYQGPLVLRYYSQMSFAEMAVILGCREGAVRTRVSRALRELRSRLGVQPTSRT